jgi:hypothetical protein
MGRGGGSTQISGGGVGGVEASGPEWLRRRTRCRGSGGAGPRRLRQRTGVSFGPGRWWCVPRVGWWRAPASSAAARAEVCGEGGREVRSK